MKFAIASFIIGTVFGCGALSAQQNEPSKLAEKHQAKVTHTIVPKK
jgi:hypothetical protein